MPSLDRRTKRHSEIQSVDLDAFIDDVGQQRARCNGATAAQVQASLDLGPLTLAVAGTSCTIDGGNVRRGAAEGAIVAVLEPEAFSDLVAGVRTATGLAFGGGVHLASGAFADFVSWDHVLRALLDGMPLPRPGEVMFAAADGSALDLDRRFTPDADDREIAHFLAEAGYLHLAGWVDPDILASIEAEVAAAARAANREDPDRWWALMADGTEQCVRVMHLLQASPTMASLVAGDAYERLGGLFLDGHRRFPERPQSSEALIKPLGVARGITEFPLHRDCSFGGHDYSCAGYAVGLPLSATGRDDGHLRVVAGSHRVNAPAPGSVDGYEPDLPVVAVMTEPGDLTVHVGCILHGTEPSRTRGRTVAYTTFSLAPLDGSDAAGPGIRPDPDRIAGVDRSGSASSMYGEV